MMVKVPLEACRAGEERRERITVDIQINHAGEVNKARHMPQSHNVIATKTVSGEVHLFDYFKHPTRPADAEVRPNMRLLGHRSEGYGLAWNPTQEGLLLSGSDDGVICVWDVNRADSSSVEPTEKWDGFHLGQAVDDVCWSWACESVYYSVGDDRQVLVWDRRQEGPAMGIEQAHTQEIMCVDTTPFDGNLVLTGSMDSQVKLWD